MGKYQKGFAAVEAVLLVVIVAIIGGTGYYVYHVTKSADSTLKTASKESNEKSAVAIKPSVTIENTGQIYTKEVQIPAWQVKAPITDGQSYIAHVENITGSNITFYGFTSQKLAQYRGCAQAGGEIGRYTASQPADEAGDTPVVLAKMVPAVVKHVGGYYYVFEHDQAACNRDPAAFMVQNANNNAVKAMMQAFVVY